MLMFGHDLKLDLFNWLFGLDHQGTKLRVRKNRPKGVNRLHHGYGGLAGGEPKMPTAKSSRNKIAAMPRNARCHWLIGTSSPSIYQSDQSADSQPPPHW